VLVLQVALVLLVVALLLIAVASGPWLLMTGAIVYGFASGLLSPATSAWTVDLSHPDHRGKAVATMYISLEAGIGLGAAVSGWIFSDQLARTPWIFGGAALAAVAGLVYLVLYERGTHAAVPCLGAESLQPAAHVERAPGSLSGRV
jgi:MFS family permease